MYSVKCVSKIKHILSFIHYTIRGAVCFQFTHFSCDDWENIYTLSYYHHLIGSMNYCPLLKVRSWNNGVCLSIFLLDQVMVCCFMAQFNTYMHIIIAIPLKQSWGIWVKTPIESNKADGKTTIKPGATKSSDYHIYLYRFLSWSLLWLHMFQPQSVLALQRRHNEHDDVSNHQPHDCLLHRLFRCRSKKTSKLCITGRCGGNSPLTGEFP